MRQVDHGMPAPLPQLHQILVDRFSCCCSKKAKVADWDTVEATPATNSWEATPGATPAAHWDATPGATPGAGSRWDATPTPGRPADGPTPRRNRWDETPTPGRVSKLHSCLEPDAACLVLSMLTGYAHHVSILGCQESNLVPVYQNVHDCQVESQQQIYDPDLALCV